MKILNQNPSEMQRNLIKELETTERILTNIATSISGREMRAEICVLPDVNNTETIPNQMFFNGTLAYWDTDVPFIPIEKTMNVSGISIYRLNNFIHPLQFMERVGKALRNKRYNWNYSARNQLIALMSANGKECLQNGQYLILNMPINEYQQRNMPDGVITQENWFYDKIKTKTDLITGKKLDYLEGKDAEKFYAITKRLEKYYVDRNDYFANLVLKESYDKRVLIATNYGMPTLNSVAVGCYWHCKMYPLIMKPKNRVYLMYPDWNNAFKLEGEKICVSPCSIMADVDECYEEKILSVDLEKCAGDIVDKLNPIAIFTNKGMKIY